MSTSAVRARPRTGAAVPRVVHLPVADAGRRPARVGAVRFERSLAVVVAVFDLLYALQNLDSLAADWPSMAGPIGALAVALPVLGVLLGLTTIVLPGAARRLFLAAAGAYVLGALVWPASLHGPVPAQPMPWFVAMWTTALGALTVACRRPLVPLLVAVAVAGHLFGVLVAAGGDVADAAVHALFVVLLSSVLVLLAASIRGGVDRADRAQRAALDRFARAASDDATEGERVRTDSLVHDSVLTTLLSAAQAQAPESEDLARRMAANALRVLSHVNRSAASGPVVRFSQALGAAGPELAALRSAFDLRSTGVDDLVLPATAAEAMLGAMLQAMSNSVQHAGAGARRSVRMSPLGPDGLRIEVEDDGIGFDSSVRSDRLGLRVSIVERLRLLDGRADVDSSVGGGCRVRLSWGSVVVSGTAPLPEPAAVVAS